MFPKLFQLTPIAHRPWFKVRWADLIILIDLVGLMCDPITSHPWTLNYNPTTCTIISEIAHQNIYIKYSSLLSLNFPLPFSPILSFQSLLFFLSTPQISFFSFPFPFAHRLGRKERKPPAPARRSAATCWQFLKAR